MICKIHGQPKSMTCTRCSDAVCPMCAEYIDGSWFCPHCAPAERRIAAGSDYLNPMAVGLGDGLSAEESPQVDIPET